MKLKIICLFSAISKVFRQIETFQKINSKVHISAGHVCEFKVGQNSFRKFQGQQVVSKFYEY